MDRLLCGADLDVLPRVGGATLTVERSEPPETLLAEEAPTIYRTITAWALGFLIILLALYLMFAAVMVLFWPDDLAPGM